MSSRNNIAQPLSSSITQKEDNEICEVWKQNLDKEFRTIQNVIYFYKYVAMDTVFAIIESPQLIKDSGSDEDYKYQVLRCQINNLQIVHLSLTFCKKNGETPPRYSTWKFNFALNFSMDTCPSKYYNYITTSGINVKKYEEDGINPLYFAELLKSSGIVSKKDIKWFYDGLDYDFGYLVKLLSGKNLPSEESEYENLLGTFFPMIYTQDSKIRKF